MKDSVRDRRRQTIMETDGDLLCECLESLEGSTFQREMLMISSPASGRSTTPSNLPSMLRDNVIKEEAIIPEREEQGGWWLSEVFSSRDDTPHICLL